MIMGFLLFHMQIFVFSVVNFRYGKFNFHFFVFCFIIAVLYMLVFAAFWLFSALRLFNDEY